MKPESDIKGINKELEKICNHPLFVNSTMYTRLLRYLVEKALQQEDIKEYSIGSDLFGKNYSENKNDGTVRIYMYKMRQKLAAYYKETKTEHDLFFQIEKGQYNLHFISKKEYAQNRKSDVVQIPVKYLKFGSALLVLGLILTIGTKILIHPTPFLWKNFLEKDAKNMLVVADKYILMHTNAYEERRATIYSEINNDEDFLAFKKDNPNRKLTTTDYTMLSKMAPFGTHHLTEWFLEKGCYLNLQLESELSLDDIKENNIIFIGQRKAMNVSGSLFLTNSKVFSKFKDGYRYKNGDTEKTYNTQHNPKGKIEYAMVSYSSFSPGKKAIYFVSNHDIGVMATLRNFTDEAWLKEFYKQLPLKSSHFNALFKVSGIHRTDVSCEMVELEIID